MTEFIMIGQLYDVNLSLKALRIWAFMSSHESFKKLHELKMVFLK